jgi:hypothetical protein
MRCPMIVWPSSIRTDFTPVADIDAEERAGPFGPLSQRSQIMTDTDRPLCN